MQAGSSQHQGYGWYSPWAWVGSSSGPLPAGESSEAVATPPSDVNMDGTAKAAEGLVQDGVTADAAGVTTEPTITPTASTDPSTVALTQEGLNPVGLTIETNRSGWASFFSSRALVVKSIAPKSDVPRDENGMETMNIDSDDESARSVKARVREIRQPIPISVASSTSSTCSEASYVKVKRGRLMESPSPTPPKKTRIDGNTEKPSIPPIIVSEAVTRETVLKDSGSGKRGKSASPAPSKKSGTETPVRAPIPNLVLPTWSDTFHAAPRNVIPPPPQSKLTKTMKFVSEVLFAKDAPTSSGKGREDHVNDVRFTHFGKELPKAWDVVEGDMDLDVLRGCQNVVVIGIHGWFPGVVVRTVLGEPTGTSAKFVNMMVQALEDFQEKHGVQFKKITKIPLEGEGTISRRVDRLYSNLLANEEWTEDLHAADAILVATHSQGSIVATHLLERLIRDQHIKTSRNVAPADPVDPLSAVGTSVMPSPRVQRVCCLALCGIHLGPLRYLRSSSLVQPYLQYFESTAARELFEFQNTESQVSKEYVDALGNVLDHGVKMLYIASMNDQVVPLYSGLFMAASHPLILRALYIDGDAYHSSDFLSNLLVLLLRIVNSGLSDRGLFAHLSEATAGSLNGVGHSTAYEEVETYSLAVRYLFLSNSGTNETSRLGIEPYNALNEQNDYEIPWLLRDLIADGRVIHFFSREISELRDAFRDWHPKTTILRDIKRKLQPIQRLSSSFSTTSTATASSSTTAATSKL
ncbi:hypothetical protein BDN72DRAFT_846231 [Pluteus cervinus]|uniref:Uncharacterized protein n=1 Tax=Pluteus cervinus TaxID=181527 RepID=A0ACD3AHG3_9AGAR|nr:hypothetical protein BDN72DRAFT_846231 [Pluteus cervinus]